MTLRQRRLLAIVGPTGSGKTGLAAMLADRFPIEVISVDSRQVYRFMDIGTAKPGREVLRKVRHHLIDMVNPDETYSAGRFARDAAHAIAGVESCGKIPLLAGGTGLYLRALAEGLVDAPSDSALRAELRRRADDQGIAGLHAELRALDPETASGIHLRDAVRIIRALEICRLTGELVSELRRRQRRSPLAVDVVGLRMERQTLYRILNDRTDAMFREGFVEEVRGLLARGYDEHLRSMQGIGYRQISACVHGRCTPQEALEATKKATRNFAKRQMTWFRSVPGIRWVDIPGTGVPKTAAALLAGLLEGRRLAFPAGGD